MRLFLVVAATIIILELMCGCGGRVRRDTLLGPQQFAYQHLYGRDVVCAAAELEPCGVSLSRCSDDQSYVCATDIQLLDLEHPLRLPQQPSTQAGP